MDRITTTIRRPWLAAIIAGEKRVEYRENKAYWRKRLASVSVPFELRLINGMQEHAPEVTVIVDRVRLNSRTRAYELRIREVVAHSNWDKRRRVPRVSAMPNVAGGGARRRRARRPSAPPRDCPPDVWAEVMAKMDDDFQHAEDALVADLLRRDRPKAKRPKAK
jgi:hypothetical protein